MTRSGLRWCGWVAGAGMTVAGATLAARTVRELSTLVLRAPPRVPETYLVAAGERIADALFLGLASFRDRAEAGANAFRLRLRKSSQVVVEVERGGRTIRKQYAVTP
jgi:hypothetical protein